MLIKYFSKFFSPLQRSFIRIIFLITLSCTTIFSLELILPMTLKNLDSISAKQYLVSEKLDGMRAYWDGKNLFTKSGKIINAPQWFIKNFPPFAIDGELWSKREDFENIISIIKNQNRQEDWKNLKLYVFEVPQQKGNLNQRLKILKTYLASVPSHYIAIIPQHQFKNTQEILNFFNQITQNGGEGIVLRKNDAPYQGGRNATALKYKKFFDSECKVIGYQDGKGKYTNMVGSLLCQDGEMILKIGSGLNDMMRIHPPKIGTIITYKYYQKTKNNKPKHPVFLRVYKNF